jgi:signal transduction histidine kinase
MEHVRMRTFYAPAEKTDTKTLQAEIEIVSHNPVMSGLLHSISGLLAILDEGRQIVALNDSFLRTFGIEDPAKALGLRPGEVVRCLHAFDEPAGCGTTEYCSTCGAAIAIVSSLGRDQPVERLCALTAEREDKIVDMALVVRAQPIRIDSAKFILLFLQDITKEQQRAALERTFFHDINNMIGMLLGASEMLLAKNTSDLAHVIHQASTRLRKETDIQWYLTQSDSGEYSPTWFDLSIGQIVSELRSFFIGHSAAYGKTLEFVKPLPDISFKTDLSLVLRILSNMIINALEASTENESVKVWIEHKNDHVSFHVWNAREIPKDVQKRIFQCNFSTKDQPGRGFGTYSMRLLGERILGGNVSFSSSENQGTTFVFTCPIRNRDSS